jgi:ketosteroid isomerase-like protein
MFSKGRFVLTATYLVLAAVIGNTQPHKVDKGEAEIRQWLSDFIRAFEARDTKGVMALYAPEVVAYDISPPLVYPGSDAYAKDYETFFAGTSGPLGLETRDVHIHVSGDLAIAHGLEHLTGMADGQPMDMWIRFTSVFRKLNGRWLDIHDHISAPADLATGKSVLDLKP